MTCRSATPTLEPSGSEGAPPRNVVVSLRGAVIAAALIAAIATWAPMIGAYLAIISALVAVHEGAHLVVARRCGLAVTEYAIGFGPVVASVKARGITWALRAIPAGGFVSIVGPTEVSKVPEGTLESQTLRGTTPARRVATIAAGPVSNLVVAVLLTAVAYGPVGIPSETGRVHLAPVDAVTEGVAETSAVTAATLTGLSRIVTGADEYAAAVASGDRDEAPAAFLSPVGAADLIGDLDDAHYVIRFAAILSAGLGVFNLLPFPPLDGGHLAVEALNAIRSRLRGTRVRTSVRTLNYATATTLAVFALLTVTALRFDLAA